MTSRDLREKRAKLAADMQALVPKEGTMTAEVRAKFDQMDADQKEMKADIDRLERSEALVAELKSTAMPPQAPIGEHASVTPEVRAAGEKKAFRRFLYGGDAALRPEDREFLRAGVLDGQELSKLHPEIRDMGVGTTTLGGWWVPQGFVYDVDIALLAYGNVLGESTILETATGNPLPYPTETDVTNKGQLVGEGDLVSQADITIGRKVFGAYKFSTKMVKVSMELLQDSAFDVERYLRDAFAIRLGRGLNDYFTTGTGVSQPEGIITGATDSGQTMIGNDNATTPDPTTEVGYLDLVELEHSVDPLYRPGAKWMFHDTTLRFLKELKDKYGRPLWLPGVAVNAPDMILGYPYSINQSMDELGSGAKAVLFGQLKKFFVRRVKELFIVRLVERFADYGQTAFLGFARYDSALIDAGTHPVKYLTLD